MNTSNTRSSVAEGKLLTKSPPCWTMTRFHGVKQTARAIIFHCRPVPCPTIARGQNNKIEQETHEYVACPSKLSFIYFTSSGVLKIGPYRLQRRRSRSWVTKNGRIGAGDACGSRRHGARHMKCANDEDDWQLHGCADPSFQF